MRLILLLVTCLALAIPVTPGAWAAPLGGWLPAVDPGGPTDLTTVQARGGGRGGMRMYRRGGGGGGGPRMYRGGGGGARMYRGGGARMSGGAPRIYRGGGGGARMYRGRGSARISGGAPRIYRGGGGTRESARGYRAAPRYGGDVRGRRPGRYAAPERYTTRGTARERAWRQGRRYDRPGIAERRARAGVGAADRRYARRAAITADRYYRGGRWHNGYPRWRGERRWHGGRYWRPAYDGWYYWYDDAWIWAPAFGVLAAATLPLWGVAYDPPVTVIVTYEPWTTEWYDWCARRYRSFDPATGYWLSYSGVRRFCVYRP